jgi:hypothetical protein
MWVFAFDILDEEAVYTRSDTGIWLLLLLKLTSSNQSLSKKRSTAYNKSCEKSS